MANWVGDHMSQQKLRQQLTLAARENNPIWVAAIYKVCFLKPMQQRIQEATRYWHKDEQTPHDGTFGDSSHLIAALLEKKDTNLALAALTEYKLFLDEVYNGLGWMGVSAYARKGMADLAEICDLAEVFRIGAKKYAQQDMSKETFVSLLWLLTDCCWGLERPYRGSSGKAQYPQILEDYKRTLIPKMIECVTLSPWEEKDALLKRLREL